MSIEEVSFSAASVLRHASPIEIRKPTDCHDANGAKVRSAQSPEELNGSGSVPSTTSMDSPSSTPLFLRRTVVASASCSPTTPFKMSPEQLFGVRPSASSASSSSMSSSPPSSTSSFSIVHSPLPPIPFSPVLAPAVVPLEFAALPPLNLQQHFATSSQASSFSMFRSESVSSNSNGLCAACSRAQPEASASSVSDDEDGRDAIVMRQAAPSPPASIDEYRVVEKKSHSGEDEVASVNGVSGFYFVENKSGKRAVFKPLMEEAFIGNVQSSSSCSTALVSASSSPDRVDAPRQSIKSGCAYGFTSAKEIAAYVLDHGNFAGVPKTVPAFVDMRNVYNQANTNASSESDESHDNAAKEKEKEKVCNSEDSSEDSDQLGDSGLPLVHSASSSSLSRRGRSLLCRCPSCGRWKDEADQPLKSASLRFRHPHSRPHHRSRTTSRPFAVLDTLRSLTKSQSSSSSGSLADSSSSSSFSSISSWNGSLTRCVSDITPMRPAPASSHCVFHPLAPRRRRDRRVRSCRSSVARSSSSSLSSASSSSSFRQRSAIARATRHFLRSLKSSLYEASMASEDRMAALPVLPAVPFRINIDDVSRGGLLPEAEAPLSIMNALTAAPHSSSRGALVRPSSFAKFLVFGSLQDFVSGTSAEELGPSLFLTEDVHRIGILDIRLLNLDRHSNNLLAVLDSDYPFPSNSNSNSNSSTQSGSAKGKYRLVPIDHGYTLPSFHDLSEVYFEWSCWPQCREPFSQETKDYVARLNVLEDARLLQDLGLPEDAILSNVLATLLLQRCVAAGLNLQTIANLVQRTGDREQPSVMERLVANIIDRVDTRRARLAASSSSSSSSLPACASSSSSSASVATFSSAQPHPSNLSSSPSLLSQALAAAASSSSSSLAPPPPPPSRATVTLESPCASPPCVPLSDTTLSPPTFTLLPPISSPSSSNSTTPLFIPAKPVPVHFHASSASLSSSSASSSSVLSPSITAATASSSSPVVVSAASPLSASASPTFVPLSSLSSPSFRACSAAAASSSSSYSSSAFSSPSFAPLGPAAAAFAPTSFSSAFSCSSSTCSTSSSNRVRFSFFHKPSSSSSASGSSSSHDSTTNADENSSLDTLFAITFEAIDEEIASVRSKQSSSSSTRAA